MILYTSCIQVVFSTLFFCFSESRHLSEFDAQSLTGSTVNLVQPSGFNSRISRTSSRTNEQFYLESNVSIAWKFQVEILSCKTKL